MCLIHTDFRKNSTKGCIEEQNNTHLSFSSDQLQLGELGLLRCHLCWHHHLRVVLR